MTDDELRTLVESIATSSAAFAEGAFAFQRTADQLMNAIRESQEGAGKAIALMIRRHKDNTAMIEEHGTRLEGRTSPDGRTLDASSHAP